MTDKKPQDCVDIGEIFGAVIRRLRQERGLSQEVLALESELHRTYVSLLERGKRIPTLGTLFRLAIVLGVLPSEIIRSVESRMGWPHEKKSE